MKPRPYSDYKDSGIDWLGAVPSHWEVKRFRFCVEASNAGEVIDRSYWHSGAEILFSCQRESMLSDFPNFPFRKRTTQKDLLVTRNGTPYVHVPPANAIYSNVVQRCTLEPGLLREFVALTLETACERLRGDGYGVSIPSFSYDKWCDLALPVPPPAEQRAIAAYLDRETGRMDELVGKQRALIERLKEKRTALISRTVTRGLPPAAARAAGLPENPPLKPSGLDWLGDIPAHWEVKPVKYVAKIGNGSTPNRDNAAYWEDGSYPWLNSSSVNAEAITQAEDFVTSLALQECHLPKIRPPAVLIGITGQGRTRGMASTLMFEATINQHVAYVKPSPAKAEVGFLRRVFDMAYDFLRSESDGGGSTKGAITCEQIGVMAVPLPPLPEQTAIAAYLDVETAKLDGLVAKVEAVIERLQEYRAALITAAVTGKIDVRPGTPNR